MQLTAKHWATYPHVLGITSDAPISLHNERGSDVIDQTVSEGGPSWLVTCRPAFPSTLCEGGGDVVGVVTPLAFHDDQVVELRVQLGVQEVEGKDREKQVEVVRERRVKEVRPWI